VSWIFTLNSYTSLWAGYPAVSCNDAREILIKFSSKDRVLMDSAQLFL